MCIQVSLRVSVTDKLVEAVPASTRTTSSPDRDPSDTTTNTSHAPDDAATCNRPAPIVDDDMVPSILVMTSLRVPWKVMPANGMAWEGGVGRAPINPTLQSEGGLVVTVTDTLLLSSSMDTPRRAVVEVVRRT